MKKLFLLDAMALVFRAYYALIRSPRITSTGRNTSAQFGFTNTLIDLINKEKPTHMAVCFDTAAPTSRHTDFEHYKANRQEAPEDILSAIPEIKRIIKGFNIPCIELDGYEADDIVGTLAWQAEEKGYEVYMVTPDKDYGQLVKENVFIYKPGYQGGTVEIMGPTEICEKWDIENVDQVIDILGLMGDAVDNIPGIAGVGQKTAAKLLKEFGTLEGVLQNAANIKGKMGEKIAAGHEDAILSKKLATIITDVPVEFHEENFQLGAWDKEGLATVFKELEFKTMGRRILGDEFDGVPPQKQAVQQDLFGQAEETAQAPKGVDPAVSALAEGYRTVENTPHKYELVNTPEKIDELVRQAMLQPEIALDTETTGIDANMAELVGMSFSWKTGEAFYIPCPTERVETDEILAKLAPLFTNPHVKWIGHNLKYDMLVLKWYGQELAGANYDTMLAHFVANPDGKHSMDAMSEQYLNYRPIGITELIGKKGKGQGNMRDVDMETIKEYAAEDADITLQLYNTVKPMVEANNVDQVLDRAELPLIKVLAGMEYEGVRIDENFLLQYSKELEKDSRQAEMNVYSKAGVQFNLGSPKQLGEVLFDKLKLEDNPRKTKTGQYQTGEDVLLKLAARGHDIVDDILAYRELSKLKSTYVDSLPLLVNPRSGRVHTTYGQAVAVTGRLSSNNPNLQNIPIRTDRGKEIRKAFIPRDHNHVLISADYSQIELRIVAAISGDFNMCSAFKEGKDIHTATAAKVYGVEETAVTKEMRYKAKSVNFGIIYGQGPFGLAENLGISRSEAQEIIANYKKEFSGIQHYMDRTVAFAKEHGYVETLLGRKRWLSDIRSANHTVRSFAERNAINSPIQGTAADMIKLAMIRVQQAMEKAGMRSRMILQVHDELVFDARKEEVEELKMLILENMKLAMPLPNSVPVEAEAGTGDNWLEAH